MDYIKNLIQANKALIKKVKQLKLENESLQNDKNDENTYYEKFNRANSENLTLKNRIAELELEVYSKNRELEKRNTTILQLKKSLSK